MTPKSSITRYALIVACMLLATTTARAQFIDQEAVQAVLEHPQVSLDDLPDVYYNYYIFDYPDSNTVLARNKLYKFIGDGNAVKGTDRARLVEMLNRVRMEDVEIGDTLVIPASTDMFELDYRAYSPFPRYYPGGKDFDKLFIIDETIQAFAAYEYGQLVRWGVVNTGSEEHPTPTGRYNFNWKEPYRVSSLSPPGELWEMYWVFNIDNERGIHVHQYAFPTGGPASHGCIRLIDADAKWIYDWADPWMRAGGGTGYGQGGKLLRPGTTVLLLGQNPVGKPHPFDYKKRYPVLLTVDLPADPYEVPPATAEQRYFDRMRRLEASR